MELNIYVSNFTIMQHPCDIHGHGMMQFNILGVYQFSTFWVCNNFLQHPCDMYGHGWMQFKILGVQQLLGHLPLLKSCHKGPMRNLTLDIFEPMTSRDNTYTLVICMGMDGCNSTFWVCNSYWVTYL